MINYGKKKIWERKLPSFTSKDEYEKLLATSLSNLRQKMKEYENIDIEEIKNEEDRQTIKILRRIDRKYGLGDALKNALEIEEWCKVNSGKKKIWERRLPGKNSKDEYERKLGIKVNTIRKKIKNYERIDIWKIENEEDRQIVQIMRRLDKEYAYGRNQLHESLGTALEIEEWLQKKYGDKKICDRKLPSSIAKDKYEKKLGTKLKGIKANILKKYESINIEQIENEEDRQIVEIIRRLDKEYNYRNFKGKDLAKVGFETGITDVKLCDEEDIALQQLVEKSKEGEINKDEQS